MAGQFVFTTCQVGSEPLLKRELAREHPWLRMAFSRPGFVTFKSERELTPGFEINSVFARAYGLSQGKASGAAQAIEAAQKLRGNGGKPLRLHVFERERHAPGEEPKGFVKGEWAKVAREAMANASPEGLFLEGSRAETGDLVFDVVVVEEGEWWLGSHLQSPAHAPWPGGNPELTLPPEAPSRAWLKMEEALLWSAVPVRKGDTAVEIGSAPGGASYSLLTHGLKVVGVDPAEMDPRVLATPGFTHLRTSVAALRREDLPRDIDWLALDMNVAPSVTLHHIDRLAGRMKETLCGLLLTVKLNEESMADDIPEMLEKVKAMGMARVRATQLSSNRREIFVYGLTRRGQTRS